MGETSLIEVSMSTVAGVPTYQQGGQSSRLWTLETPRLCVKRHKVGSLVGGQECYG